MYEGDPLTNLAADCAFPYLGIRASLVGSNRRQQKPSPCLNEEKNNIFATTKDIIGKAKHHKYLLSQMVLAMHMVATSRFRHSAPLVPWTDAELDQLHTKQ